jgi:hypothetical protein
MSCKPPSRCKHDLCDYGDECSYDSGIVCQLCFKLFEINIYTVCTI